MKWPFNKSVQPKPASDALTPVVCRGPGRTGSTLLMELLLTSETMTPEPLFPHENRLLNALAISSLSFWRLPEDLPVDLQPAVATVIDALQIRPCWPWRSDSRSRDEGEEMLWRQFFLAQWELLSKRLKSRQPQARYYAEKCAAGLPWILRKAKLPHRQILRSRDPRDLWCSLDSFAQRRGHELQGPDVPLISADQRLPVFIERFRRQYTELLDGSLPKATICIKYEDLVRDLPGVASRLGQALGIELDAALALDRTQAHPEHRTTASPEASIGRWKTDMLPQHQAVIERELGPVMQALGYT